MPGPDPQLLSLTSLALPIVFLLIIFSPFNPSSLLLIDGSISTSVHISTSLPLLQNACLLWLSIRHLLPSVLPVVAFLASLRQTNGSSMLSFLKSAMNNGPEFTPTLNIAERLSKTVMLVKQWNFSFRSHTASPDLTSHNLMLPNSPEGLPWDPATIRRSNPVLPPPPRVSGLPVSHPSQHLRLCGPRISNPRLPWPSPPSRCLAAASLPRRRLLLASSYLLPSSSSPPHLLVFSPSHLLAAPPPPCHYPTASSLSRCRPATFLAAPRNTASPPPDASLPLPHRLLPVAQPPSSLPRATLPPLLPTASVNSGRDKNN